MFGVISVLLISGMEIILTKRINDVIEEVSEEVPDKKKIKYMEEYPTQLILMGLSRQSKIFTNSSKVLPKNSDSMKVNFNEIILKKNRKVISLRGRLEARYHTWLAEWAEIAGAVVEDDICPEIDICYLKEVEDLDRVYKKLVNNFRPFQLEVLVDDIRIYSEVGSDKYDNIVIPVTEEAWRVFTVDTLSFLCTEYQKEELVSRIAHTNLECFKVCCTDEKGDLIPTEDLRKNIAQRMEIPLHFKKYSVSRDHYFNDRRELSKVQEYMDSSKRRWKDLEERGQNYGKEWHKSNEKGFRVLNKGPNQEDAGMKRDLKQETQREKEIKERKKARDKEEEEPDLNRKTIELGKKTKTASEGLSYKNNKDLIWSTLGKRRDEPEAEYEEEDSETMEELREEARLLEEDLQVPLEELVQDLGLQVKGLRRNALANHMVELWSRFQRGEIVNPNDFMEEMSKVNLKLDRQYGAESREEEDLHGLTSKPASEESSSGKLVSNEEEFINDMTSKIDNMANQRRMSPRRLAKEKPMVKKKERIELSSTTSSDELEGGEKEKEGESGEGDKEEDSNKGGGLSAWMPSLRLPLSRTQSEMGEKADK